MIKNVARVTPNRPAPAICLRRSSSKPITLAEGDQIRLTLSHKKDAQGKTAMLYRSQGRLYFQAPGIKPIELGDGEFVVGRSQRCHLQVSGAGVSRTHLKIKVRRGLITIEDTSSNGTNYLVEKAVPNLGKAPLSTAAAAQQAAIVRPMSPQLAQLRDVNQRQMTDIGAVDRPFIRPPITRAEAIAANRPELAGRPGALLWLNSGQRVLLVGDLHAQIGNLEFILDEYRSILEEGGSIVLLGDAVHPEEGDLSDMASSIDIMDRIIELKQQYPDQFHYLKGNHDEVIGEYVGRMVKSGVPQGYFFQSVLKKQRGAEYLQRLQEFYDSCPRIAVIQGEDGAVIAGHTPVLRGQVDYGRLRTAVLRNEDELALQWSRPWQSRSAVPQFDPQRPYKQFYTNIDLVALREALGLPEDTVIVAGHSPNGGESAYIPEGMPNHVIIHAAYGEEYDYMLSVVEVSPKGRAKVVDLEGSSGLAGI